MKRDMEIIRDILFVIEEQYIDVALYNLIVKDYDQIVIAYHCNLLYDAGLISDYDSQYGDNELIDFGVGSLTWEGYDYSDKIRSDTVWNKTKTTIKEKVLPLVRDVVKEVATAIVTSLTQVAIKGII